MDHLLQGRIDSLVRKKRNKYKRLYFRYVKNKESEDSIYVPINDDESWDSVDYFSENDEEESDNDDINGDDDMLDLNGPNIKEQIIDNIMNSKRYTKESKLFSYSLYSRCPSAYNYFRQVFPFLSECTLYKSFNSKCKIHKKILTNLFKVKNRFELQKKVYNLSNEKIECLLAVNAFAGSTLHRLGEKNGVIEDEKHVFIFFGSKY